MRGAGWGHGIGMSQYGAYGFAKHGAGYRDILAPLLPGHSASSTRDGGVGAGAAAAQPLDGATSAAPPRPATGASTRTRPTSATRSGSSVVLRSPTGRSWSASAT